MEGVWLVGCVVNNGGCVDSNGRGYSRGAG